MVLNNSVQYLSLGVAMHAHSHVVSSLLNRFFPQSNILKQPVSLKTVSSVTVGSSCSASLFASFSLFTLFWTHSDSLSSVEISLTIILFYSSSSVEQTCNKFSSTSNSFDLLSSVEKREISKCVSRQSFLFLRVNYPS